jgi:hypothetical protein
MEMQILGLGAKRKEKERKKDGEMDMKGEKLYGERDLSCLLFVLSETSKEN